MQKESYDGETGPVDENATSTTPVTTTNAPETTTTSVPTTSAPAVEEAIALLPEQGKTVQELLKDRNFLVAGFASGILSTPIKNGSLQLRSEPVIPKGEVGPFLQSDYQPDLMRREFEFS